MKNKLLVITLLAVVFISVAWSQSKSQWEYKFEYGISEKKANELGAQGWELCTASSAGSGIASNVETFVFKRPKP